jgi:hypothetical protein
METYMILLIDGCENGTSLSLERLCERNLEEGLLY